MRPTTIEKRTNSIVAWIKGYKRQRGVPPTINAVWQQCAYACRNDRTPKRWENAGIIYDRVMLAFA